MSIWRNVMLLIQMSASRLSTTRCNPPTPMHDANASTSNDTLKGIRTLGTTEISYRFDTLIPQSKAPMEYFGPMVSAPSVSWLHVLLAVVYHLWDMDWKSSDLAELVESSAEDLKWSLRDPWCIKGERSKIVQQCMTANLNSRVDTNY